MDNIIKNTKGNTNSTTTSSNNTKTSSNNTKTDTIKEINNSSYKTSNLFNAAKSFLIKKKAQNNITASYLSGIGDKVKNAIEDEYNILAICVLLGLLLILIVILYKNIFSRLESKALSKVTYYKELQINPNISTCSQLDKTEQYRLCDYYIASSYNTLCIGNQHFDYVSTEMYSKVLHSGARYIQLPICSKSVEYDTIPVVGTAQNNKSVITSLNTLDLNEVLSIIRSYAFKYIKSYGIDNKGKEALALGSLNYPLFIHLQIHTHNDLVLNKAHEAIKNVLGSYLLPNDKYYNFPLSLEKLCNLTNKIVLISTPGYETSELVNSVVPTTFCFRSYIYDDIEDASMDELSESELEDYYKRNISFINQKKSYANLEIIKKNIIDILDNDDTVSSSSNTSKSLDDIFNNKHFEYGKNKKPVFKNTLGKDDLFLMYNMIGLTLIEPQSDTSTTPNNPNTMQAFFQGCQFISMNYHLNDDNMLNYINIFKKSSFVLKPSGLRIGLSDENIVDLLDQYKLTKLNVMRLNIIPNFVATLANEYILLSEIVSPANKVLSYSNTNIIKFNTLNRNSQGKYINLTNSHAFRIVPSALSNLNDCVNIITTTGLAITINKQFSKTDNLEVHLEPLAKNMNDLQYQTFYPEEGLIKVNEDSEIMASNAGKLLVSFRVYNLLLENKINESSASNTINTDVEYYLGFERNNIRLLAKTKESLDFCTLSYHKLKVKTMAQFEHMNFGGIVLNNTSETVFASKKTALSNASKFEILNYKGDLINDDNKERLLRAVVLRSNIGKLLKKENDILYLDKENRIKKENIFLIGKENVKDDQIIIMGFNGDVLSSNNNGMLEFKPDPGNNLGISKYFNIKYSYENFSY